MINRRSFVSSVLGLLGLAVAPVRRLFAEEPDGKAHWRNYTFEYKDGPTREELLRKITSAMDKTKFEPPVPCGIEYWLK